MRQSLICLTRATGSKAHSIQALKTAKSNPLAVVGPRQVQVLLFGGICVWLLGPHLRTFEAAKIPELVALITLWQWILAVCATMLSFWALGRYDVVVHQIQRTGINERVAAQAGMTAIALSQTLGAGLISGAFVRWKLLPDLSFPKALGLSGAVGLAFLGCSGLLLCLSNFASGGPLPFWLCSLTLASIPAVFASVILRPELSLFGKRIRLPTLQQLGHLILLTMADTVAATLAFALLLPPDVALSFFQLYPIFILALATGLVSGTPGGLGAFELTLLSLLPNINTHELIATILAFRLVYFALPAGLAIIWLIRSHLRETPHRSHPPQKRKTPALSSATRSETALIRNNGGRVGNYGSTSWAVIETGQALVALFDPLSGDPGLAFGEMRREASRLGLSPLLYKCCRRTALTARKSGWTVLKIADEHILNPQHFDFTGPAHRQLRRKLRQASRAGVTCRPLKPSDPRLCDIANDWTRVHGPERGLSMGRYDPQHIQDQLVFVAFHSGRPIAFVSFHESQTEMCLDMMRHRSEIPQGTMQMLVITGIEAARARGHHRLSLAATTSRTPLALPGLTRLRDYIFDQTNARGLYRFKSAFPTRAEPLYAAAPNIVALTIALADITRAIHAPDHIVPARPLSQPDINAHNHLENYEFASL